MCVVDITPGIKQGIVSFSTSCLPFSKKDSRVICNVSCLVFKLSVSPNSMK